jgi:hypothetical protein
MAFARFEPQKRACTHLNRLGSRHHLHRAVDDEHPGVLVYLMFAKLLARAKNDEDSTRSRILMDHHRIKSALRCINLAEVPLLHGGKTNPLHAKVGRVREYTRTASLRG